MPVLDPFLQVSTPFFLHQLVNYINSLCFLPGALLLSIFPSLTYFISASRLIIIMPYLIHLSSKYYLNHGHMGLQILL